jgi:hypothetical protein
LAVAREVFRHSEIAEIGAAIRLVPEVVKRHDMDVFQPGDEARFNLGAAHKILALGV